MRTKNKKENKIYKQWNNKKESDENNRKNKYLIANSKQPATAAACMCPCVHTTNESVIGLKSILSTH